jgi:putative oxidoreductase
MIMALLSLLTKAEAIVAKLLPSSLASLALRFALAVPFYRSGLTKWEGFGQISESALFLFSDEFKLHIFDNVIDYPMPTLAAYGAGIGELALPILLVLGIGTRFAALGLLLMTAVIQLTVPDGWPIHLTWAAMALGIIALGAGKVSIDYLLGRAGVATGKRDSIR